jgi:hypothetical protein
MADIEKIPGTRREPLIPVGHPDFKWTSGADVQATWHRYTGWTPPSANHPQPPEAKPLPAFVAGGRS